MKAILRWITALSLCCASTFTFAGSLPGSGSFGVGYNEAWFGDRYSFDLTSAGFDQNYVYTMFDGMAKGGATIVRIWPFAGLQGIQLNQSAPQTQGLRPDVMANLNTVLWFAQYRRLKVYVTLLIGGDMQNASGPRRDYYYNLLANKYGEGDAFKWNVLYPFLNLLNYWHTYYPDAIYALDLINEIEAALNSNYFPDYWIGARSWIQNMTAFVKSISPWLAVTSTAGFDYAVPEITYGLFSGVGLDFYDLHAYADAGQYPGQTALCRKVSADNVPIILGEYGQKSQTYNDNLQYSATANFIYGAKTHCFSAALAWKYETSQTWLTYRKTDGSFRPAYYLIQYYGTPH